MTAVRALSIQHAVLATLHSQAIPDPGSVAVAMAGFIESNEREVGLAGAIDRALRQFRPVLTGTAQRQEELRAVLIARLTSLAVHRPVEELLLRFSHYAQRELARAMKTNPAEEFLRSNLQSWLASQGCTHREAHHGSGQVDLMFRLPEADSEVIVEVKVPPTRSEYESGIAEAAEYGLAEGCEEVYFVFADHCRDLAHPRFQDEALLRIKRGSVAVVSIAIRVAAVPPSKVGRSPAREGKPGAAAGVVRRQSAPSPDIRGGRSVGSEGLRRSRYGSRALDGTDPRPRP